MGMNPDFEDKKRLQITETLHNFEKAHKEDLEAIVQAKREDNKPYSSRD